MAGKLSVAEAVAEWGRITREHAAYMAAATARLAALAPSPADVKMMAAVALLHESLPGVISALRDLGLYRSDCPIGDVALLAAMIPGA